MMDVDSVKDDGVKVDSEVNEAKENEKKDEEIKEDGSEDEELDDDEFEVDRILDVAAVDGEVKYKVRWKGYGSDEDSWEPEQNLKTARLILDEYNASHQDKVKKAQDMITTRRKLRKRSGWLIKQQNKGNKKSRRSSSSEYSEVTKTHGRAKRRRKLEKNDDFRSSDDDQSDDDHEESFKRRRGRPRGALGKSERIKIIVGAKNKQNKQPLSKDLSPKKAKNAWLYDDAEDADSDASDRSERAKKSAKGHSQLKEYTATKKTNMSPATTEEQYESISDETFSHAVNERKLNRKEKTPVKGNDSVERMPSKKSLCDLEPKVEFTGVVQCHDGAIKVIYNKRGETRAHIVSVREAFEIDGYGLVQYFISRCEFGNPGNGNI
uniref:Chromo domain-containing protein n=1 Tax=Setaria digitata TaxID=48799 RepID=A0A915PHL8_9BILA